jgi:hypothetical protein
LVLRPQGEAGNAQDKWEIIVFLLKRPKKAKFNCQSKETKGNIPERFRNISKRFGEVPGPQIEGIESWNNWEINNSKDN